MTVPYPGNQFANDQPETDQYGGRSDGGNTFDAQAWTWITGLLRAITISYFAHVRVSYDVGVSIVQEGVAVGDVLAVDLSRDATDPVTQFSIPWVGKYTSIVAAAGTPKINGVCVQAAASQGKALYARGGLLPKAITGLGSVAAASLVSVDPVTNKLRVFVAGDESLGYSSPNGNVFLQFSGRVG